MRARVVVIFPYPRGDQYMIIPPQAVAPMYFAPHAKGQEGGGADKQRPYPPIDLGRRVYELHLGPSPGGFHAGGAGGGSRAGADRLVPGKKHNTTKKGGGEGEGDDEAVLLSTAWKERKGREEIRRKERLAAQVTGWRHDRDVMIGSEMEVTGRGEKSQKPLSLSRGGTPSAGSAWDSYLFLPPLPCWMAGWATVVIRMGNDQPVRVQSRLGEPRGL